MLKQDKPHTTAGRGNKIVYIIICLVLFVLSALWWWINQQGYYSDEPFPSADGKSIYILRIHYQDVHPPRQSSSPLFSPKAEILEISSPSHSPRLITPVEIDQDETITGLYFTLRDHVFHYIIERRPVQGLPPELEYHKSGLGVAPVSAVLPPGNFFLEDPSRILELSKEGEVFLLDPITGKKELITPLPEEIWKEEKVRIINSYHPHRFLVQVKKYENKGNEKKKRKKRGYYQTYLFDAEKKNFIDLNQIAEPFQKNTRPDFADFYGSLVNMNPNSDYATLINIEDINNIKVNRIFVPSSDYQLSPHGKSALFTRSDGKMLVADLDGNPPCPPPQGQKDRINLPIRNNSPILEGSSINNIKEFLLPEDKEFIIHKYFWFPGWNKVIVHKIGEMKNTNGGIADKILSVEPSNQVSTLLVPPCPAYTFGRHRIAEKMEEIKEKLPLP